jgi:predicted permease
MDEVFATFTASLRSVGTACTLAAVGMYLHHRGFIVGEGKRTLALISQQVTIPLLLFTKIVYCNQDWSSDPCPSVTDSLEDVWMILFCPLYVCGCGLLVGWAVAKICGTPPKQVRSVLAACGFGN